MNINVCACVDVYVTHIGVSRLLYMFNDFIETYVK